MIKKKVLYITVIFKTIENRLKTFWISKQIFILQNIREWFLKIVFKTVFQNCFKK